MTVLLTSNTYGKAKVRLSKIIRQPDRHVFKELIIAIKLRGGFDKAYTEGDNRLVLPTDTMKNTVYALAKNHSLESIEQFGLDLCEHFQQGLPHVHEVEIRLEEILWQGLHVNGAVHPHTFMGGNSERYTSQIIRAQEQLTIQAGLQDLTILKTTGSGFTDFLKDDYTTLQETDDRILATNLSARWHYKASLGSAKKFSQHRQVIRQALIETFANHDSQSLQQTLYVMGRAALEACPDVSHIYLAMPNKHHLLVDLSPFNLDNHNEIFLPVDEPQGVIEGELMIKVTK